MTDREFIEYVIYSATDRLATFGEWLMMLHYRYDTYLFNKRHGGGFLPPRIVVDYQPLRNAPTREGGKG